MPEGTRAFVFGMGGGPDEGIVFLIAVFAFFFALCATLRGWRWSHCIRDCARRRLARAALLAFFLTPGFWGTLPAPAFLCMLAGAASLASAGGGGAQAFGLVGIPLLSIAAGCLLLDVAATLYWRLRRRAA